MQQQSTDPTDTASAQTPPAVPQSLATAYSSVFDDQNLLLLVVQHLALSSHHLSRVSSAWRQASHHLVAPGIQHLVHDITRALESSSVRERGLECIACSVEPEALHQTGCLGCGAPLLIRGLSTRQQDRWIELYRDRDGEDFDTWLLFDCYSRGWPWLLQPP